MSLGSMFRFSCFECMSWHISSSIDDAELARPTGQCLSLCVISPMSGVDSWNRSCRSKPPLSITSMNCDLQNVKPNDKLKSLINTLEIPNIADERSKLFEAHKVQKKVHEDTYKARLPNLTIGSWGEAPAPELPHVPAIHGGKTLTGADGFEMVSPKEETKIGEVVARSGASYKGGMTDQGVPHGVGEYENPAGDVYIGEWMNGRKHGAGKYVWASHHSYDGFWADDKRSGFGRMDEPTGVSYEGEWANDVRHGAGVYCTQELEIQGEWVDGNLARGHEVHKNGKIEYYGEYADNRWSGKGKVSFADGTVFEGSFANGVRHGRGRLFGVDQIFECEWVNGAPNGRGKFSANGWTCEGLWKDGVIEEGTLMRSGHGVYVGGLKNFVPHGRGEEYLEDGCYYSGEYDEGRRHGFGTFKWSDGTIYQGAWLNDLRIGQGRMIFANGRGWQGEFNESADAQQMDESKFIPIDLTQPTPL
eukprot:gene12308-14437_t